MAFLSEYAWAVGALLSPFVAALLVFIARLIIRRIDKFIPNWMRRFLFIRWN